MNESQLAALLAVMDHLVRLLEFHATTTPSASMAGPLTAMTKQQIERFRTEMTKEPV